jgi:hypothetical protein
MTREEIISMRDDAFNSIGLAYQTCGPITTWSADQRMALTMTQLVYHAAVTQLAQLDDDAKVSKLICLLDGAKGCLLDLMHEHHLSHATLQPIRLALVEALDVLEA